MRKLIFVKDHDFTKHMRRACVMRAMIVAIERDLNLTMETLVALSRIKSNVDGYRSQLKMDTSLQTRMWTLRASVVFRLDRHLTIANRKTPRCSWWIGSLYRHSYLDYFTRLVCVHFAIAQVTFISFDSEEQFLVRIFELAFHAISNRLRPTCASPRSISSNHRRRKYKSRRLHIETLDSCSQMHLYHLSSNIVPEWPSHQRRSHRFQVGLALFISKHNKPTRKCNWHWR